MSSQEKALALLQNLDTEQRYAALAPIGPVRIVAGAGTGKTRTLIHRIAYWHYMGTAPANKVLAVTFTRKSATELRHRLRQMGISGVTAQTFHSAALSQLREFWKIGGHTSDFPEVLTGLDQYMAIRRAITQSLKPSEDPKQPKKKVDTIMQRNFDEELTMIRSQMIDLKEYLESAEYSGPKGTISKAEFVEAVQRYEDAKKKKHQIDFDDVLIRCVRMIENVPLIAEKIRSRYEHFLVDEYQDNDPVQERLLDAWLGGRTSICVVGDPRQTIFSYKGADPKIMRDFPNKHQSAVTVELTKNYRSTKHIVEWANRLMRSTSASAGAKSELAAIGPVGWKPQVRSYFTEKVELEQSALRIKQLCARNQVSFGEVAVLVRFRADIVKFRRALKVAGINSVSPNDEFWRDVEPVLTRMKRQQHDTQLNGKSALMEALNALRWTGEVGESAEEEEEEYSEIGQSLIEITDSIEGVSTMSVTQLLETYKILEEEGRDATDGEAVNVMTIHQSKGLEWDAVYLPRFVEGALPTSHAKTQEQLDEERRLAYVGITRARKFLELSWGETYKFIDRAGLEKTRGQSVSSFEKFLIEVPVPQPVKTDPKTAEWNKRFQPPARKMVQSKTAPKKPVPSKPLTDYEITSGTKETVGSGVRHKDLGQGTIIAVASSYAIVDFGKEGRYKIDLPPY